MTSPAQRKVLHATSSKTQGFTIIELMVVVAIVSILAVIAIPVYLDYIVRSKVGEAMVFVAEAKTSVTESFYSKREMPTNNLEAGLPLASQYNKHQYISSLQVMSTDPRSGTIRVQIKIPGSKANGKFLQLVPDTSETVVIWTCTRPDDDAVPINQSPPSCRG